MSKRDYAEFATKVGYNSASQEFKKSNCVNMRDIEQKLFISGATNGKI